MPEEQYTRTLQELGLVRLGNVSEATPLPVVYLQPPLTPVEVATTDTELSVRTDAGTGLTVVTDADAPLRVRVVDGSTTSASTISVTATAAMIGSAGRLWGEALNSGATVVYVGGSAVTSTNGYPIAAGARLTLPRAPIYCVTASGETGTLKLLEVV